jgi:hypothetical protein
MNPIDVSKLDLTKTNAAIDRLLEVTTNPRHRFLLQTYYRHRYLEIAGRYEEIFAPDMTVETPVYHFNYNGVNTTLEGQDAVKKLYRLWTETNQTIFYVEREEIAVADHYVASTAIAYQQVSGSAIRLNRVLGFLPRFLSDRLLDIVLSRKPPKSDDDDMYLVRTTAQMIWPYDENCRMIGEDVWETDPDQARLFKLDRSQVLTPRDAARILDPFIKPLPRLPSGQLAAAA